METPNYKVIGMMKFEDLRRFYYGFKYNRKVVLLFRLQKATMYVIKEYLEAAYKMNPITQKRLISTIYKIVECCFLALNSIL